MLCLLFTATVTPYEIAFVDEAQIDAMFVLNQLVNLVFLADVGLQVWRGARLLAASFAHRAVIEGQLHRPPPKRSPEKGGGAVMRCSAALPATSAESAATPPHAARSSRAGAPAPCRALLANRG